VRISRGKIELDFRAKHSIRHRSVVSDRNVARILKNCRDLPGSELFQYLDENDQRHTITFERRERLSARDLRREITAKDFRTWAATNLAMIEFCALVEEKRPNNPKCS